MTFDSVSFSHSLSLSLFLYSLCCGSVHHCDRCLALYLALTTAHTLSFSFSSFPLIFVTLSSLSLSPALLHAFVSLSLSSLPSVQPYISHCSKHSLSPSLALSLSLSFAFFSILPLPPQDSGKSSYFRRAQLAQQYDEELRRQQAETASKAAARKVGPQPRPACSARAQRAEDRERKAELSVQGAEGRKRNVELRVQSAESRRQQTECGAQTL